MTQPATPPQSPGLREALIRRIELARAFIAKEHADPTQEVHGDWISREAKPAHDALCLCLQALAAQSPVLPPSGAEGQPRVTDDDKSEITITLNGKGLRGWSYKDDAERRVKMLAAREYVEGWCDGRDAR